MLDLVDPCAEAYTHREYWRDLAELWKLERPAVGWDIAVTGDLACIWINTRTADDVYRLAVCLTFKGCKVESQRRVMEAIFEALPYAVGAGDAVSVRRTVQNWRRCSTEGLQAQSLPRRSS